MKKIILYVATTIALMGCSSTSTVCNNQPTQQRVNTVKVSKQYYRYLENPNYIHYDEVNPVFRMVTGGYRN